MKAMMKVAVGLGVTAAVLASPASGRHSWGGYHWARTTNPLAVKIGDNVSSAWDAYLVEANIDWNKSTVIESPLVAGSTNPSTCDFVPGTIQVCNAAYGENGWLGLASIEITNDNHITRGTTKLNDTYYSRPTYNTPAWRRLVMCQEIGHDYGLDHQNEAQNNRNLGTCMDYTNSPTGGGKYGSLSNEHPNQHDYDQLVTIYSHLDGFNTSVAGVLGNVKAGKIGNTPDTWGRPVRFMPDGRPDMYVRLDGPGRMTITHVFWAPGEGPRNVRGHH